MKIKTTMRYYTFRLKSKQMISGTTILGIREDAEMKKQSSS
jgi:hypothetical protein